MRAALLPVILSALPALLAWPIAHAQDTRWPARPVRLVVPFAPGGANDVTARSVAQKLGTALGQPVLVENHGGAGGTIGTGLVARAAPDGQVLLMGSASSLTVAPGLYAKLSYDPIRDFAPVSNVAAGPYALVVHPSVPARSVQAFVALARSRPGGLDYASSGPGSMSHLATEMMKAAAGIDMVNISYKGTAPAVSDLLGGHVHLMMADLAVVMPQVSAGRLRALAVTSAKRASMAPALPTLAEAGFPDFAIVNWRGVLVPAGTPREIVVRLNTEIVRALRAPELRDALVREGYEPIGDSPEQFAALIRSEVARFTKAIRTAGIAPI